MRIAKYLLVTMTSLALYAPLYAEPTNIQKCQDRLSSYHDTGAYMREFNLVVHQAKEYIQKKIELNRQSHHPKRLALVLDIDETTISNYKFLHEEGFGTNDKAFDRYLPKVNKQPLKPMLNLYKFAKNNGVSVFFVTGRREKFQEPTTKSLVQAGYEKWDGLYFKPQDYQKSSIIPFKSEMRKEISRQGYEVVASIGDQMSDLLGGYADRGFKLPNPFYYLP